jgi:predicted MFS family arabinose efflux permease
MALADLGVGIGPMIMGLILQRTNYPTMFIFLALIGAVNFLYFGHTIRKKRKQVG